MKKLLTTSINVRINESNETIEKYNLDNLPPYKQRERMHQKFSGTIETDQRIIAMVDKYAEMAIDALNEYQFESHSAIHTQHTRF